LSRLYKTDLGELHTSCELDVYILYIIHHILSAGIKRREIQYKIKASVDHLYHYNPPPPKRDFLTNILFDLKMCLLLWNWSGIKWRIS